MCVCVCGAAGRSRQQLDAADQNRRTVPAVPGAARRHERREGPRDSAVAGENPFVEASLARWSRLNQLFCVCPQTQITTIQTDTSSSKSSADRSLQLRISELLATLEQRQTTITRQEEVWPDTRTLDRISSSGTFASEFWNRSTVRAHL